MLFWSNLNLWHSASAPSEGARHSPTDAKISVLLKLCVIHAHTFSDWNLIKINNLIWRDSWASMHFQIYLSISVPKITDFIKNRIFARRARQMPDMQESASHHVNDLATPGFTAKLTNHMRQDVQIEEKARGKIYNCVLNDNLKPYRPKIFEKLYDCAFFRFLPEGPARCQTCRRALRTM